MKTALVGIQWGDEGKGKYVTYFLGNRDERYGVCARFNGGGNAGHTLFPPGSEKELATHQVPSGVVFPGVYNAMLEGVFVDPVRLMKEIQGLQAAGYKITEGNLGISGFAHVTLLHHIETERHDEQRRGKSAIGTTFSGIGPTAVDKYGRTGMRFGEFVEPESFKRLVEAKRQQYQLDPEALAYLQTLGPEEREAANQMMDKLRKLEDRILEVLPCYEREYKEAQEFLRPFLLDEAELLKRQASENWLYEGAQGGMLDPAFGSYPYVTSTHAGKAPSDTDDVVGVAKADITRVGGGRLPTRMDPETEALMRGVRGSTGAEYGATTGRPRSCGWFDAPVARHCIAFSKVDRVALVKLDILNRVPKIKVCTHYDLKGKKVFGVPADRFEFEQCEPVYKEVDGWPGVNIDNARELRDLPPTARDYLKLLQDEMERPIDYVSVGPRAEQTIEV